jgi:hypothetical protein
LQFENRSGLEAALMRGDLPVEGETLSVIVAKASGEFDSQGRMTVDLDLKVPICFEPMQHELGLIPADSAIRKDGTDVLALGKAYHPAVDGGPESSVIVRMGDQERELRVFGQRYWQKVGEGQWEISEPEPFSLMELRWSGSFGGESFDAWGNDSAHSLNAEGKGFIGCEDAIEDTPLPNIEDPDHLIQNWEDSPRPCNIAPAPKQIAFDCEPEMTALENARNQPYQVPPAMWNDAVSKFRFHGVTAGSIVELSGMSEVPLYAVVPAFQLRAHVELGGNTSTIELVPDTILFFPEARRCLFTWRGSFIYRFVPKQTRRVVLERST